jgi:hypothetical protein
VLQNQRAAAMRIALEAYEPFIMFRTRLVATGSTSEAAEQTKVALELEATRDEIGSTLVSLGTYALALITEGGGHHTPAEPALEEPLLVLVTDSANHAAAEQRIRSQLGAQAMNHASYQDVISPLSDALCKAGNGDASGAVKDAGNAIESYLTEWAGRTQVNIVGANGINAKTSETQGCWCRADEAEGHGRVPRRDSQCDGSWDRS